MKMWMSRFALLAVLGGLLCSAFVVGCSKPEEEVTTTTNTTTNTTTAP